MDHNSEELENTPLKPRPKWQRYLAWIGLGLFCLFLIFYYWAFFTGGYQ